MGAPRHAAQLATWQPVPLGAKVGAGVGPPLLLRVLPPLSADAPLATQLEPLAVCTLLKPCKKGSVAAARLLRLLVCSSECILRGEILICSRGTAAAQDASVHVKLAEFDANGHEL